MKIIKRTILCVVSLLIVFSISCKSVPEVSTDTNVPEKVSPSVPVNIEISEPTEPQAIQLTVPTIPIKPEKKGNFPDFSGLYLLYSIIFAKTWGCIVRCGPIIYKETYYEN